MRFPSVRRIGRVFTNVLACALAAGSMPVLAQDPGSVGHGPLHPAADSYELLPGDTLSIVAPGVMANDSIITEVEPAWVSVVSGPAHGTLNLGADGGFDYTPAKGFSGVDGFRYRVQAGNRVGEADVTLVVFASSNIALTVSSSAQFVDIGSPVTFTFNVVNRGPAAADSVELTLMLPPTPADAGVRQVPPPPDGRCHVGRDGKVMKCALGRVEAGATVSLPHVHVPLAGGPIDITGVVTTSDPDANANDNAVTGHAVAGRLSAQPGHVIVRATRADGAGRPVVNSNLALANEWPMSVSYEIGVADPTLRDVVPGWISIASPSGALQEFSAASVRMEFALSGAPGLRRAVLHINHDSPSHVSEVPVSFTLAFRDVSAERADDAFIHALAGAGVTSGCGQDVFCPDQSLTRAQAAVWMLRAQNGTGYFPPPAEGIFQDVSADRRDAAFIEELARRGVAGGCDGDNFCPEEPLARADAAVMVMRMLQGVRFRPQGAAEPMFKDLTDDPRRAWVEEAVLRGLFAACDPDGALFCPDQGITRGDAAVAVVKAFKLPLF